jgi:uncharacterized protein
LPEFFCNTSPLQYLHQAGLLDLLPKLTGGVIVPDAVAEELNEGASQQMLPVLWVRATPA